MALLFRIPPRQVDEFLTGGEAIDVLEYLNRYPQTEDLIDTQLARIVQCIHQMCGNKIDINDIRLRGTQKTDVDIAEDWIRWIDERKRNIKD